MKKIVLILALILILAGCNQSREQAKPRDESRKLPLKVEEKQGEQQVVEAEEWYVVEFFEGKCKKISELGKGFVEVEFKTPADVIKNYRQRQMPYSMRDEKEVNGKVVETTLIDIKYPEFSMTFYYGFQRCKAALETKKMKRDKELEKYK